MIYASGSVGREPWLHEFTARTDEVAQLRRTLRIRLILWGLVDHVDVAQLCVSELVTNVVQHVGEGTPVTLRVALRGPYLRVEVEDPDTRSLPTLLAASSALESGRGMALVDAMTDHRWGVLVTGQSKVVWCELTVDPALVGKSANGPRVTRAEALLDLYGSWSLAHGRASKEGGSLLSAAAAEDAAIGVMADLLHWLWAHGHDPDAVLDRAQTHFEAEIGKAV